MEKITTEYLKDFINSNEIPFIATQSKLCIPIIARLCRKMAHGIKFEDIKTCDNLVIDGHHRYLSSLLVQFKIGRVLSEKTSNTKAVDWTLVEFDKNDWDTSAKINHLNKLDAIHNNLDIDFITQLSNR